MAEDFNKDRVTVLIDGNSVIYRAFYNVPPLTAGGVPTGVIHVFLSVLEKLRTLKYQILLLYLMQKVKTAVMKCLKVTKQQGRQCRKI